MVRKSILYGVFILAVPALLGAACSADGEQDRDANREALIESAVEAIAGLPDEITLDDEEEIELARQKVNEALEAGASEEEIENLCNLSAAEDTLTSIKAIKDAVYAAVEAIDALSAEISLDDQSEVEEARAKVESALDAGVKEEEISNLNRLEEAEATLAAMQDTAQKPRDPLPSTPPSPAPTTDEPDEPADPTPGYGITPFALQPLAITSAGGTSDGTLVQAMANHYDIENFYEIDLESLGNADTLILVAGRSFKLGSPPTIDYDVEVARVDNLITEAREAGASIIAMHLGGTGCRGALSDPFNKLAAESADLIIVAGDGDHDNFFTDIANTHDIPIVHVPSMRDAGGPLAGAVIGVEPL